MNRRFFIGGVARAAGGLGAVAATTAGALHLRRVLPVEYPQMRYKVRGFTCVTCAVGLETVLSRTSGVIAVSASYSLASVSIRFDRTMVTEAKLASLIAECGFAVVSSETLHAGPGVAPEAGGAGETSTWKS